MRTHYRIALVGVFLVLTFGLCIHWGATDNRTWPSSADAETIAENPAAYDGERVLLFGTVQSVDADANRATMVSGGVLELEVRDFEKNVEPGGIVQVYGELDQKSSVQYAENTVVVNNSAGAEQYKLAVSAIAVLLAAGLFLWYWRIDWWNLSFEVRHG